ncbi:MAG: ABC transporter permease [Saccharofermentans sp.]|nr:ABC transporter permease [Saccharofermentans sp.]
MNKIIVIIKWEISRILNNWRKAAALFVIPAAVMMLALNLFPFLINYMSTGSFSGRPIIVVDATKEFYDYIEETSDRTVYTYEFISQSNYEHQLDKGTFVDNIRKGCIYCVFQKESESISVQYNRDSAIMEDQALSFIEVVLDSFNATQTEQRSDVYSIDSFNPVTKILNYRSQANYGAARVIPAVLVLILYYCTYSLMVDIFASEKDRGFWNKLIMTPVSASKIVIGKLAAVIGLVSVSTYITFIFLFLSSWLNTSNSSTSLIPFGLLLLPRELFVLILIIPITAYLCASICLSIIFAIDRMKDIIINLQMPLIFILLDMFFQLFYYDVPNWAEFYIPLHGSIAVLRAAFMTELSVSGFILTATIELLVATFILARVLRKEGYIHGRINKRT